MNEIVSNTHEPEAPQFSELKQRIALLMLSPVENDEKAFQVFMSIVQSPSFFDEQSVLSESEKVFIADLQRRAAPLLLTYFSNELNKKIIRIQIMRMNSAKKQPILEVKEFIKKAKLFVPREYAKNLEEFENTIKKL